MMDAGSVNTGSEHYRTVSTRNEHDPAVKFSGRGEREKFLKGLGITVSEEVVREVIECCSGVSDLPIYQLYTKNKTPQRAGKPTIYKIKRLYESGELADFVEYLDSERSASSSEVNAPARLDATGTIQPANSDGSRPGVREQPPPVVNTGAINNLPDNEWAADRPARKANPSLKGSAKSSVQPHQRLLRTHHPRDVARAIDVSLKDMRRRAQYAQNPPLKMPTLRFHPEPDVYQQAIIATIKQIDPPFAECIRRFDEAVERGERQEAGDILNQLEKGLMSYTTKLR